MRRGVGLLVAGVLAMGGMAVAQVAGRGVTPHGQAAGGMGENGTYSDQTSATGRSVVGRVASIQGNQAVVDAQDGSRVTISLGPNSQLFEAGVQVDRRMLQPGSEVRASYGAQQGQAVAERIDLLPAVGEGGPLTARGPNPPQGRDYDVAPNEYQSGVGPSPDGKTYFGSATVPHPTKASTPMSPAERRQLERQANQQLQPNEQRLQQQELQGKGPEASQPPVGSGSPQ